MFYARQCTTKVTVRVLETLFVDVNRCPEILFQVL